MKAIVTPFHGPTTRAAAVNMTQITRVPLILVISNRTYGPAERSERSRDVPVFDVHSRRLRSSVSGTLKLDFADSTNDELCVIDDVLDCP